jgi:hypothetical protein
MKFFRIDLLTLLISLFILNSCKNENLVGLAPGANSLTGTLDDTATVYTNTILEDTIATTGITKLPLGYLIDPVLGTTESDMITDINLPGNDASSGNVEYTVPTGSIIIDSALLVLKYADGFYGDSTENYTLNAYQLTERPFSGKEYYDNKRWTYNAGSPVGSVTFQPRPLDSLKIYTIVHGAKDTLIKVPPQLRIPISASFLQTNFFGAGSTALNSNLIFQNNVKGFFLNVSKTNIATPGGTMMFQAPADSALQVYVRITNGSVVDTNLIYLNISEHATQINHVFSTQVQNALSLSAQNAATNTTKPDNYIFLQGGGGLKSKITFPYLQSIFNSIPGGKNNVVINRAELVITDATAVQGDIPAYLVPLPKLTLYRHDITGQSFTVEDATSGEGVFFGVPEFGGYYNNILHSTTIGTYHFLITGYIQNLLDGVTIDYGTYVAPVDTTNTSSVDIAPTLQTSARTIGVGGASKTATGSIKLNVIYTKTRQ